MKRLKIKVNLGDLQEFNLLGNEAEASFRLDFSDTKGINEIVENLPEVVKVMVKTVMLENSKEENAAMQVQEILDEEKEEVDGPLI